jgi:ribonuclease P protein component
LSALGELGLTVLYQSGFLEDRFSIFWTRVLVGLAKAHRLPRSAFDGIYRKGRRVSGHYCRGVILNFSPQQKPISPQIGIVISKKVSKRAVVRNRLRRQIQAAFQYLLPHLSPGWQGIIIVQAVAVGCTYGQILAELEEIFKKAKVLAEVLNGHS